MKPLIGIVARVEYPGGTHKLVINDEYRRRLISKGADVTLILPQGLIDYGDVPSREQEPLTQDEKDSIIRQIKNCDGILMPGGFKTNNYDLFIMEYAIDNDIPILGICLGMQILSFYKKEEIGNDKNETDINHCLPEYTYVHQVTVDTKSKLYSIVKEDKFLVNSRHNYHARPNDNFDVVAYAPDGIPEAIEMKNKKFVIGVQWHPENLHDEQADRLFDSFLASCNTGRC